MGAKRIKAQNPESKSRTPLPRRQLNPRIACRDKAKRIEMLKVIQQFWADHKEALELFCDGKRDVVFPSGTYKMQEFFNVRCEPQLQVDMVPT